MIAVVGFKYRGDELENRKIRICSKCGAELDATLENFRKNKRREMGIDTICKNCSNSYDRAYRKKNHDSILSINAKYREKNKDAINIRKSQWYQKHKEQWSIYVQTRQTKIENLPATLTQEQWNKVQMFFDGKCAYCGLGGKMTQDHFVPLSDGGEYTHNNIIPVCEKCNKSKSTKNFEEWYKKQPFYSKEREKKIYKYLNYKNGVQQLKIGL